ncbi:hypothetical protein [Virgibacillus dokdonensis]|uniref:hypothetical protein n=1 Tax=Virgibacillus dokdonensis TaxID=302167 RepID=UPI00098BB57C|nr:hypothetical protein [Virgibacillus dokdonensis]
MNDMFQEKKGLIFTILALFFVLLLVIYVIVIHPLFKQIDAKETDMQMIQEDISKQEQKLTDVRNQDTEIDTIALDKQIPKSKEIDELLLIIEKIATISSSRVEDMEFAYDESLQVLEQEQADEEVEDGREAESSTEENTTPTEENEAKKAESEEATRQVMETVATSVHTVQLRVKIFSPKYKNFKQFLQQIEKLERVTMVHAIEMEKPGEKELTLEENPDETVEYTVELMTFYDRK